MADAAKQRLLAIDVGEVSIVDHPANLEEFVVTKGCSRYEALGYQQGILKAVWTTAYINALPDNAFLYIDPKGKKVDGKTQGEYRHFPYKNDKGEVDLPHLRNALARIPDADVPDAVKTRCTAEAQRILEHAEKKGTNKADSPAGGNVTMSADVAKQLSDAVTNLATILKANPQFSYSSDLAEGGYPEGKKPTDITGMKLPPNIADAMKTVLDFAKKFGPKHGEPDADDEDKKMEKAIFALAAVSKAGRAQLSKDRVEKIHQAMVHLAQMYKDADEEGFNKAMSSLYSAKPATGDEGSANKAGAASVGAAGGGTGAPAWFDSAISNLTKKVDESIAEVSKRVEAVEKSAATTKSAPGDDEAKVQKGKTSFWSGVL